MRRGLAPLFMFLVMAMPAAASEFNAEFLIKRKGKVIGFHRVEVALDEDKTVANTTIRMKVKVGPIVVFRYAHDSVEEWRGGEIRSIESETNRNGKEMFVRAARGEEGLEIEGTKYSGVAPAAALPSSYWNKQLVSAPGMINTQHGEVMDIVVTPKGETETEAGQTAEQFHLIGTAPLDLWYDGARWVGASFEIDGEALVYELVDSDEKKELIAKYER